MIEENDQANNQIDSTANKIQSYEAKREEKEFNMLLQKPDKPKYDGHYILGSQDCKIEAKGGNIMIRISDSEVELNELFSKDDFD